MHELLDPLLHIRMATVPDVPLRPSERSQKLFGLRGRNCHSCFCLHLTLHPPLERNGEQSVQDNRGNGFNHQITGMKRNLIDVSLKEKFERSKQRELRAVKVSKVELMNSRL